MGRDRPFENARKLIKRYRVTQGETFRLRDVDPSDTGELTSEDKPRAQAALRSGIDALVRLQDMLYAQDRWALLAIFQAMDAAGKDSAIEHVMSGVNPAGCRVASFKAPSPEELDHDYLWRCERELPERGRIGIFNRSYYEEVLVVRVRTDLLAREKLPARLLEGDLWKQRYEDIRNFERFMGRNGTCIVKFFLHVSRGGAEATLPRAPGRSGEAVEVLVRRSRGAGALEEVHARLRGDDPRDRERERALVRRPGRPQMVHPDRRGGGDGRCPGVARSELSEAHPGPAD